MASVKITDKTLFQDKFLTPISRFTDNVSLTVLENGIETVGATQDSSAIVFAHFGVDIDSDVPRLNIPDIKKFSRLLDCINVNELDIEITTNSLKYKTKAFKFNYFLLEDMYMQRSPINVEKIKALPYDCSFTLPSTIFGEILRGSSIAADSDKLYFVMGEDGIYAELNDRERHNINNLTYHITDKLDTGELKDAQAIPLNLENIRLLSGIKVESFKVKINSTLKVVVFEVAEKGLDIKFIISGLVK